MGYLFWFILNVSLGIGFIVFCYKKTIQIKQKLGLFAAILFVLISLSFINRKPQKLHSADLANKVWVDKHLDSTVDLNLRKTERVIVYDNIMFSVILHITYTRLSDEEIYPIRGNIFLDGTFSGFSWHPVNIELKKQEGADNIYYKLDDYVEFSLLGINVSNKYQSHEGRLTVP